MLKLDAFAKRMPQELHELIITRSKGSYPQTDKITRRGHESSEAREQDLLTRGEKEDGSESRGPALANAPPNLYQMLVEEKGIEYIPTSIRRKLAERGNTLSERNLLKALLSNTLDLKGVLRALPTERRIVLYNMWKQEWLAVKRQLLQLVDKDAKDILASGEAGLLAELIEMSYFNPWLNLDSLSTKSTKSIKSLQSELKKLPINLATDLLDSILATSPSLPGRLDRTDLTSWILDLPASSICQLLLSHPEYLLKENNYPEGTVLRDKDGPAQFALPLLCALNAEQQVEVHKQQWGRLQQQQHDELICVRVDQPRRYLTVLATIAIIQNAGARGLGLGYDVCIFKVPQQNIPLTKQKALGTMLKLEWSIEPQPSPSEVSSTLSCLLEFPAVQVVVKKYLTGIFLTPARRPFGLDLSTYELLTEILKPPSLTAVFEGWHDCWREMMSEFDALEAEDDIVLMISSINSKRTRGIWESVLKALRVAAQQEALKPWLLEPTASHKAKEVVGREDKTVSSEAGLKRTSSRPWMHLSPSPSPSSAGAPPRVILLRSILDMPHTDSKLRVAAELKALQTADLKYELLPLEGELLAQCHPASFLENTSLLEMLSNSTQMELLQKWAVSYHRVEHHLHVLLRGEITTSELTEGLEAGFREPQGPALELPYVAADKEWCSSAQRILIKGNTVASGALKHVCQEGRKLLFETCRHSWLSDWGQTVDVAYLPEAHRTEVARSQIAALTAKYGLSAILLSKVSHLLPWLTWKEMVEHPLLKEKLQGRSPAERQEGMEYLFQAARMKPCLIFKVLDLAHQRRREQDSFRLSCVEQLKAFIIAQMMKAGSTKIITTKQLLGTSSEGADHDSNSIEDVTVETLLPAVKVLYEDALAAKDVSPSTLKAMFNLLLTLLPHHLDWVCDIMAQCAQVHGLQAFLPTKDLKDAIVVKMNEIRVTSYEGEKVQPSLSVPTPTESHKPTCNYHPPLESFLLQLAAGLKLVQQALSQRQDGAVACIQLLQMQWELGWSAHDMGLIDFEDQSSERHFLYALIPQLIAVAELIAEPTQAAIKSWKELGFLAIKILRYAPDKFVLLHRHVFPRDAADAAAFSPYAVTAVQQTPPQRLDILISFITENVNMPTVAAKAVRKLFAFHKKSEGTQLETHIIYWSGCTRM
ncbi:hypothetical protein CEUSTIGMA_g8803.t1 [Chlamydomonas eustigma]|uniref:Uncharacterized protein n=1 Tax=Chlamydomonas eustigma TaxID=1157962 RepID=A0A250XEM9_9CHLO|nr:hypothetical protein CEUSTIGMA_g8803.t1 [Chlamydomonas eustigma]|eukprot:GAX81372.1 hypothetical protein CEUSTIGMA_g8803.t1 [Chlamydomonas eustigma]